MQEALPISARPLLLAELTRLLCEYESGGQEGAAEPEWEARPGWAYAQHGSMAQHGEAPAKADGPPLVVYMCPGPGGAGGGSAAGVGWDGAGRFWLAASPGEDGGGQQPAEGWQSAVVAMREPAAAFAGRGPPPAWAPAATAAAAGRGGGCGGWEAGAVGRAAAERALAEGLGLLFVAADRPAFDDPAAGGPSRVGGGPVL